MNPRIRACVRAAFGALALSIVCSAQPAVAGGAASIQKKCAPKSVPITGAFVGVPIVTVLEDGRQKVDFTGVGAVTDLGDALCVTIDEIFDPRPGADPAVYGRHRIIGEKGDSFVVNFVAPTATVIPPGAPGNPNTNVHIIFEGTWKLENGTGRYAGATAEGQIYVHAEIDAEGQAVGRWSMWGDIEYAPHHHGPRWCR